MIADAALAGGLSFAVGLAAPLAVRPMLRRLSVTDVPNERSSHSEPTLRGGGLAPLAGWIAGTAAALPLLEYPEQQSTLVFVALTAFAASGLGFADDLRGLRASVRLILQLLLGLFVGAVMVFAEGADIIWVPVVTLAIAGFINFANFMDGINGMSALNGIVFGVAFAWIGFSYQMPWLVMGGLALAGAFLAFVPWNLSRPGLFLGDVGSYLLGAAVAVAAVVAWAQGVDPLAVLSPTVIYLADTVTTIVRRAIAGESIFTAHRGHTYQRLTDSGLGHPKVSTVTALFSLAAAITGIGGLEIEAPRVAIWAVLVCLAAAYLSLPLLLRRDLRSESPEPVLNNRNSAVPLADFAGRRVGVFGASGFVGEGVLKELDRAGITVERFAAPRLSADPSERSGALIATAAANEPVLAELSARLAGIDVVINAAGLAAPDSRSSPELVGANSLLPAVIGRACADAGVARFVHLSSASVQGRRLELDETAEVAPFSPYSRSKALGEQALLALTHDPGMPQIVIVRATSVQGTGRPTTVRLQRLAKSWLASVAAPGDRPTVVSSLEGLARLVRYVSTTGESVPSIVLQPWEGLSTRDVLVAAGGRAPRQLPVAVCRVVLWTGFAAGRMLPSFAGLSRRLEMMWFGQRQVRGWADERVRHDASSVLAALGGAVQSDVLMGKKL
ncbi:UDP-N-acetylglucosamine-1-phosphate transferase [Microbacterium sp. HM58-2]|nr:UDP-N-acetylglucosamine-1-phosphate transferase [Microbacterium sp. HM58-2]